MIGIDREILYMFTAIPALLRSAGRSVRSIINAKPFALAKARMAEMLSAKRLVPVLA